MTDPLYPLKSSLVLLWAKARVFEKYFSESAAVFVTDAVGDFIKGEPLGFKQVLGFLDADSLQVNR
jgi:hypothetical protein